MNILIVINMVPIALELSVDEDVSYFIVLRVLNYIFCSFYVSEAVIKVKQIDLSVAFRETFVSFVMQELFAVNTKYIDDILFFAYPKI